MPQMSQVASVCDVVDGTGQAAEQAGGTGQEAEEQSGQGKGIGVALGSGVQG